MATRYDVHFQPVMPTSAGTGFKVFTFGFTAALKVRGSQSLVNRWAMTFMTPKGSDLLHPSYGTEFGSLAGSNLVSDYSTLQDIVVMAIDDANDQVRKQGEMTTLSNNELLDAAVFNRLIPTASGDGFDVWIVINNRAGESLPLKLTLAATR